MVRQETATALARRLAEVQASCRLPSLAAGVGRGGRLVWFGGAGEVAGELPSDETQYRCGSISKTFVAAQVLRLRDEGLVELGERIAAYLPELSHLECTVAHLLSHTSGLRAETAGPWWERTEGVTFSTLASTSLRREDVLFRPGRRFHYSNVGYGVLGELIARLRGRSWDDVVVDELVRPSGMVRTTTRPVQPCAQGYGVHPHADVVLPEPEHDAVAMAPAGQLWTTVDDLCRWAGVLAGQSPSVLSPDTAAEMREPIALADSPSDPWTLAYGLGIMVFNLGGRRSYGHGGSMPGFLAGLRIAPDSGEAAVVMTNATSGLLPGLENELLELFASHEPRPPTAWRPVEGAVPKELLAVTGEWYWGTTPVVVSVKGADEIDLSPVGYGRGARFRRAGPDRFVGQSGYYDGENLTVVRRSDGSISHLDIGSFVLTRSPYDPSADVPGGVDEGGWRGRPRPQRDGLGRLVHGRSRERADGRDD